MGIQSLFSSFISTRNNPCVFTDASFILTDESLRYVDISCTYSTPCITGRVAPTQPLSIFYGIFEFVSIFHNTGESTQGTWTFNAVGKLGDNMGD